MNPDQTEAVNPSKPASSARENDFLHVFNLDKAVEQYNAAGNTFDVNGFPVIGLDTLDRRRASCTSSPSRRARMAPTSHHGGEYIVVSGKLDPHVSRSTRSRRSNTAIARSELGARSVRNPGAELR